MNTPYFDVLITDLKILLPTSTRRNIQILQVEYDCQNKAMMIPVMQNILIDQERIRKRSTQPKNVAWQKHGNANHIDGNTNS